MNSKKSFTFIGIVLLLFFASVGVIFLNFQKFEDELSLAQVSSFIKLPGKKINLIFVGDIMLDRGVEAKVKKYGADDWRFPFAMIADDIKGADILFGNLEGPISDKGIKVGSIYSFRDDPGVIEGLKYSGFDILSVANNHMFDYSIVALEDTFLRLKEAGIDYVGGGFDKEEAYAPLIREVGGTKIAYLAYTSVGAPGWSAKENFSGISWLTKDSLEAGIKEAKELADIVIISFHFGEEYKTVSNSDQQYFARLAIDSGADLVAGHHPHVSEEIEEYKNGYIAYSLGNFIFDQDFSQETMESLLLKVTIENKKITEVTSERVEINEFFQPELARE